MNHHLLKLFKKQNFLKVFFDIASVLLVTLAVFLFLNFGKPYQRGFNCDDESILYPFKESTISSAVMLSISVILPCLLIILIETINYYFGAKPHKNSLFYQIYNRVLIFIFGAFCNELLNQIIKNAIGRLRPHFIDVCHPQLPDGFVFRLDDASRLACVQNYSMMYITDYTCSNNQFKWVDQANVRLSFLSGHSSSTAFGLIYLAIYLQVCLRWRFLGLLKSVTQVACICLVVFTGMSRISDYKHHWSDVLAGLVQGTVVAVLVVVFVSDLFQETANTTSNGEEKTSVGKRVERGVNSDINSDINFVSIDLN